MKRILTVLVACSASIMAFSQSDKQNFDFNWKFIENEVKQAEDLLFDDRDWTSVDLPHDWDISHAPALKAPMGNGGGYYPGGIGKYVSENTRVNA